ncbi:hypothetical protein AB205_0018520, partial [Aquarana catesbeiana]
SLFTPFLQSNSKLKLVRSLAVCEESSGPFVDGCLEPQDVIHLHISCPSDKEEKCCKDGPEKDEKNKEKGPKKMLSRDSSQEYTDSTGIDVHEFLVNTLKNNPRDRMMLLKLEQEILEFINDNSNQFKKFPQMTSYHRMLLHRAAAYFGMDHNVDQTGKAVIINKTSNTRIPEQRFSEHIKDEKSCEFQQRFILKRDDASMDRDDNQIRVPLQDGRRSKSIEEREEEGNRDFLNRGSGSRQSSTESELKSLDPRPWSSTDSDGSCRNMRPPVTKASSFSGISILTRGDSIGSNKNAANRTGRPGALFKKKKKIQIASTCKKKKYFLIPKSQGLEHLSFFIAVCVPVKEIHPLYLPSLPLSLKIKELTNFGLPPEKRTQFILKYLHLGFVLDHLCGCSGILECSYGKKKCFSAAFLIHPQQAGFIMASGGQAIPPTGYPSSGHPSPTQQVMPPQGFMQPPQQIQVSYYPTGQYPNSSQQYRPLSHPAAYNSQRNQPVTQPPQQPGMQSIISNQPPAYQGMMGVQQSQNPTMLNNQRASVGNQMQSMMVQYTPLPSYQVPVGNESQGVVPQTYQQSVLVPTNQAVQGTMPAGGMPVYYSVIPQAQQNGVNPSSLGVVVMQLNVPNGPQTTSQNPPVVQWNHCKYFSVDQRGQKPEHLYAAEASTQHVSFNHFSSRANFFLIFACMDKSLFLAIKLLKPPDYYILSESGGPVK